MNRDVVFLVNIEKEREIFQKIISKLLEESETHAIIVEGPHDKSALEALGVVNVHAIGSMPEYEFAENIARDFREVILLLDLDKEGKRKTHHLTEVFQSLGVKVERRYANEIRKTELRNIEGIMTHIKKIGGDIHGQSGPSFSKIYYSGKHARKRRG